MHLTEAGRVEEDPPLTLGQAQAQVNRHDESSFLLATDLFFAGFYLDFQLVEGHALVGCDRSYGQHHSSPQRRSDQLDRTELRSLPLNFGPLVNDEGPPPRRFHHRPIIADIGCGDGVAPPRPPPTPGVRFQNAHEPS